MTDRAKMVRPVMQWVRELTLEPTLVLKRAAPIISAPFSLPIPPGIALPSQRSKRRAAPAHAAMRRVFADAPLIKAEANAITVQGSGIQGGCPYSS
jgi:hypothetical protein